MNIAAFFDPQKKYSLLTDAEAFHCEAKLILLGTIDVVTLDNDVVVEFHHSCFCVGWFSICTEVKEAEIRSNQFQLWCSVVSRHHCN